jgi:hypothetical protein
MGEQCLGKFTANASKQRTHQYTGVDASSPRGVQNPVENQREDEEGRKVDCFIVLDVDFGETQVSRNGA